MTQVADSARANATAAHRHHDYFTTRRWQSGCGHLLVLVFCTRAYHWTDLAFIRADFLYLFAFLFSFSPFPWLLQINYRRPVTTASQLFLVPLEKHVRNENKKTTRKIGKTQTQNAKKCHWRTLDNSTTLACFNCACSHCHGQTWDFPVKFCFYSSFFFLLLLWKNVVVGKFAFFLTILSQLFAHKALCSYLDFQPIPLKFCVDTCFPCVQTFSY